MVDMNGYELAPIMVTDSPYSNPGWEWTGYGYNYMYLGGGVGYPTPDPPKDESKVSTTQQGVSEGTTAKQAAEAISKFSRDTEKCREQVFSSAKTAPKGGLLIQLMDGYTGDNRSVMWSETGLRLLAGMLAISLLSE